jgi:FtsZ-binding cell division protein ZapB
MTGIVKRIEELEKENERLKGDLELWESGGCRATNLFKCGVVKELKEQIDKLKADIEQAIEDANRWKETETFSVLNRIYNDNFELKEIEK